MTDATLLAAVGLALTAGVATFFSPCAFPLLPGYVGYYASRTDGDEASLGGSLVRGLAAGIGVLATLLLVLGAALWIGYSTLSSVTIFEPVVGLVLVAFGLLVVFDRAPSLSIALPKRRSSPLGFGVFGVGYALAAAGCSVPYLTTVIAGALAQPPASATVVLGTYVASVVVLMVSLTVATGVGLVASAGALMEYRTYVERLAGVLMIVAGIGQLYLAIVVLDAV